MDALKAEELLQNANSLYVIESNPAFIFIYNAIEEVNQAFGCLLAVFEQDEIAVHIRYNPSMIRLSIISQRSAEVVNIDNLKFHNSEMFKLIRPMANKFNGVDVYGRKYQAGLLITTGLLHGLGGIRTADLSNSETGLRNIVKFSTQLVS